MTNYSKETTAVGIFVIIGLLCVGYLTIRLGKMEIIGNNGYTVKAFFNSATGLKVGASIDIAGVSVGRVTAIHLIQKEDSSRAYVELRLKEGIKLTEYSIASIKTSGLIGDKYISIDPGGSETILADGDEIEQTESAVDLESLISKYVFGGVK
ncbi:outer membrane lipid asymmetry maintenance protein MlaD [Desulfovibrio litoralis]|uniref:Phospholipid/cholesterol/gamma-HCH transport system substrate-binding protein n=1 Tax=Desulfovibrio litoralis DSM 11393 TaxID=1121455 RepID=A0A1M7S6L7_9BACT|nr:outer membrane lipid asymmetry maintenance protein MlaD [Desulfovibrio litoralis]SHN54090.1 phospholipid/cholesterol/gamma-HCH transport system substrate-binding protein [Desulfovibrio litoralis DSM 11393]